MNRKEVYESIDTEREYQDRMTKAREAEADYMVVNHDISHSLLNIEKFTREAVDKWYYESPENQYEATMEMLRKIAGVCVKMGEKYGVQNVRKTTTVVANHVNPEKD